MKLGYFFSILITFLVINDISGDVDDRCPDFPNCSNDDVIDDVSRQPLSRRKRSLVFPDGSSLQLVFCLQVAALIPIGDIFLYGSTVALAWPLPKDPQFLYDFKSFERNAQSRADAVNNIYYLDGEGKVIAKVPYKRKMLINPAFAKRSIKDKKIHISDNIRQKVKNYKQKLHEMQRRREYLNREHMDTASIRFHRSSRIDLLQKLEIAFTALGYDGRACVQRKLCEAGRAGPHQMSFLHEIQRTVFTLPKSDEWEDTESLRYDSAHAAAGDCETLYGCPDFIFE